MKKIILISLLFSFGSVFGTPRLTQAPTLTQTQIQSSDPAIDLDEIKKGHCKL